MTARANSTSNVLIPVESSLAAMAMKQNEKSAPLIHINAFIDFGSTL
jgi:hypothetical protein